MKLAAAAIAVLLVAGCGGGEPDVDWSQIPSNQQVAIRDAVEAGNCQRMQTVFDSSSDADVLAYLDWHMKDAGCY